MQSQNINMHCHVHTQNWRRCNLEKKNADHSPLQLNHCCCFEFDSVSDYHLELHLTYAFPLYLFQFLIGHHKLIRQQMYSNCEFVRLEMEGISQWFVYQQIRRTAAQMSFNIHQNCIIVIIWYSTNSNAYRFKMFFDSLTEVTSIFKTISINFLSIQY